MDNPVIVFLFQNIFLSLRFSDTFYMHLFLQIKSKIFTHIVAKYVYFFSKKLFCKLNSKCPTTF
jgi:hypothetical protein